MQTDKKKNTYKAPAEITGVATVSDFNRRVEQGDIHDIINVTEVLQSRQIADMADEICERGTIRVVLIAGPSSSGKTTFSKRLSVQLMAVGLKPVALSTDDYFVPRHLTPKDEDGNYDFESLYAVDLDLFNEQLQALIAGKEVRLPRFNFETGLREWRSDALTCKSDTVLIIEGIHALNPLLTESVAESAKYRIFCSVLSDVSLDGQQTIVTTDNRLLRRILRDSQYRGFPAEETILRWPSVRRGEEKWITPFIGEADVWFDSSFLYELAVMKRKLEPILQEVHNTSPAYETAQRLLGYIEYFKSIPDKAIPPTSLLREFFGGSSYKY
jgi:Uridine kinase